MPRKDIDLSAQHIAQMDVVRDGRRVTYSDVVKSALDEYFSPKTPGIPDELADRLDGTRSALEQIQQRLWSLDSASQKSTERLAALEDIAQQSMELLILIGERLSPASAEEPEPMPAPSPPATPAPVEENPITDIYHDPRSRWYIPPPKEEKRRWFGRSNA